MRITTSKVEVAHLAKAWIAISIAFTILYARNSPTLSSIAALFIISGITVGIGFLLHELAHKVVAQHYGLFAEFRADNKMLLIAMVTALFGIVLAAPGAVYISGYAGVNRNGKISMAGPLTNIALAAIFLLLTLVFGQSMLTQYGQSINAWIAIFNMIPFGNFDGSKILQWNKLAYTVMLISSILLMVL